MYKVWLILLLGFTVETTLISQYTAEKDEFDDDNHSHDRQLLMEPNTVAAIIAAATIISGLLIGYLAHVSESDAIAAVQTGDVSGSGGSLTMYYYGAGDTDYDTFSIGTNSNGHSWEWLGGSSLVSIKITPARGYRGMPTSTCFISGGFDIGGDVSQQGTQVYLPMTANVISTATNSALDSTGKCVWFGYSSGQISSFKFDWVEAYECKTKHYALNEQALDAYANCFNNNAMVSYSKN
eukprot:507934_1